MLQDLLDALGLGRDAVALKEAESFTEGALTEPDTRERIEEPFVQVICHPTAILDFTWRADVKKESGRFLDTWRV